MYIISFVFTAPFDQCIPSLLNKSISFKKLKKEKNLTDAKILNGSGFIM